MQSSTLKLVIHAKGQKLIWASLRPTTSTFGTRGSWYSIRHGSQGSYTYYCSWEHCCLGGNGMFLSIPPPHPCTGPNSWHHSQSHSTTHSTSVGVQFSLYSDKAPFFLSALFAHVNAMLGIRHVTSAARTARSNCQAETLVKCLSEHLKFYAKNDYTIEEIIPLIEVNSRATLHSKLLISPYERVFDRSSWRSKYHRRSYQQTYSQLIRVRAEWSRTRHEATWVTRT